MNIKEIQRFQKKIELDIITGCWLWTGAKNHQGYGQISVNGRTIRAHRLSYEHWGGLIPFGKQIDHLCRNRSCVNPQHLEVVTGSENSLRGIRKTYQIYCKNGHELKGDNLDQYHFVRGIRKCRTCKNERLKLHMRIQRMNKVVVT